MKLEGNIGEVSICDVCHKPFDWSLLSTVEKGKKFFTFALLVKKLRVKLN
jgi:hypothetical protein